MMGGGEPLGVGDNQREPYKVSFEIEMDPFTGEMVRFFECSKLRDLGQGYCRTGISRQIVYNNG